MKNKMIIIKKINKKLSNFGEPSIFMFTNTVYVRRAKAKKQSCKKISLIQIANCRKKLKYRT